MGCPRSRKGEETLLFYYTGTVIVYVTRHKHKSYGKIYVGSSKNIRSRFRCYKYLACKNQKKLYNSFLKYGVESHKFDIILECTKEELLKYEFIFGMKYDVLNRDVGLNCKLPAIDDIYSSMSEDTKEKIRNSRLGIKFSSEHRKKISIKSLGNTRCKDKLNASKKIINKETGEIFLSIKLAAKTLNINRTTLNAMLSGQNPNKTPLIYA